MRYSVDLKKTSEYVTVILKEPVKFLAGVEKLTVEKDKPIKIQLEQFPIANISTFITASDTVIQTSCALEVIRIGDTTPKPTKGLPRAIETSIVDASAMGDVDMSKLQEALAKFKAKKAEEEKKKAGELKKQTEEKKKRLEAMEQKKKEEEAKKQESEIEPLLTEVTPAAEDPKTDQTVTPPVEEIKTETHQIPAATKEIEPPISAPVSPPKSTEPTVSTESVVSLGTSTDDAVSGDDTASKSDDTGVSTDKSPGSVSPVSKESSAVLYTAIFTGVAVLLFIIFYLVWFMHRRKKFQTKNTPKK